MPRVLTSLCSTGHTHAYWWHLCAQLENGTLHVDLRCFLLQLVEWHLTGRLLSYVAFIHFFHSTPTYPLQCHCSFFTFFHKTHWYHDTNNNCSGSILDDGPKPAVITSPVHLVPLQAVPECCVTLGCDQFEAKLFNISESFGTLLMRL